MKSLVGSCFLHPVSVSYSWTLTSNFYNSILTKEEILQVYVGHGKTTIPLGFSTGAHPPRIKRMKITDFISIQGSNITFQMVDDLSINSVRPTGQMVVAVHLVLTIFSSNPSSYTEELGSVVCFHEVKGIILGRKNISWMVTLFLWPSTSRARLPGLFICTGGDQEPYIYSSTFDLRKSHLASCKCVYLTVSVSL